MKSNYKAMVLSCIDPRFQPIVYTYLKKKKLNGKYSSFTIAGSAIGVTAKKFKKWHKVFWDNFGTSVKMLQKKISKAWRKKLRRELYKMCQVLLTGSI